VSPSSEDNPRLFVDFTAEDAAIAAALASDGALEVVLKLREDDLYQERARTVLKTMRTMVAAGIAVDPVTVSGQLNGGGQELKDYVHHLAVLPDVVCANAGHYCRAVTTAAGKRRTQSDLLRQLRELEQADPLVIDARNEPQPYTARDFCSLVTETIDYAIPPYVIRGGITEFGSKIKGGKTTLVCAMCAAAVRGEPFLNYSTKPVRVAFVTEEGRPSFRNLLHRVHAEDLDNLIVFTRREFQGWTWTGICDYLAAYCVANAIDVLVIDTLLRLAGVKDENDGAEADAAMQPLQAIADLHIGVIVNRHNRKSSGELGDAARGSSAYGGAVDVLVSVSKTIDNTKNPHYRELECVGRFDDLPESTTVAYEDGRFTAVAGVRERTAATLEALVLTLMPGAKELAAPAGDIIAAVIAEGGFGQTVIKKKLADMAETGLVCREKGAGDSDPHGFGYWQPTGADAQGTLE
jgi:hypothetical protein